MMRFNEQRRATEASLANKNWCSSWTNGADAYITPHLPHISQLATYFLLPLFLSSQSNELQRTHGTNPLYTWCASMLQTIWLVNAGNGENFDILSSRIPFGWSLCHEACYESLFAAQQMQKSVRKQTKSKPLLARSKTRFLSGERRQSGRSH
jgi:hypothetical protein